MIFKAAFSSFGQYYIILVSHHCVQPKKWAINGRATWNQYTQRCLLRGSVILEWWGRLVFLISISDSSTLFSRMGMGFESSFFCFYPEWCQWASSPFLWQFSVFSCWWCLGKALGLPCVYLCPSFHPGFCQFSSNLVYSIGNKIFFIFWLKNIQTKYV